MFKDIKTLIPEQYSTIYKIVIVIKVIFKIISQNCDLFSNHFGLPNVRETFEDNLPFRYNLQMK